MRVKDLEVGKTDLHGVMRIFGPPMKEIDVATWKYRRAHFGDERTKTIWRYWHAKGSMASANARFLHVEFDGGGKLADYYYSSSFSGDNIPEPDGKDFDLFQAKEKIIVRETTKEEILEYLGPGYRLILINKPGTAERWHYGYTAKSDVEKQAGMDIDKIYGKSLDVDFDAEGTVIDLRGESDFPADRERILTR